MSDQKRKHTAINVINTNKEDTTMLPFVELLRIPLHECTMINELPYCLT